MHKNSGSLNRSLASCTNSLSQPFFLGTGFSVASLQHDEKCPKPRLCNTRARQHRKCQSCRWVQLPLHHSKSCQPCQIAELQPAQNNIHSTSKNKTPKACKQDAESIVNILQKKNPFLGSDLIYPLPVMLPLFRTWHATPTHMLGYSIGGCDMWQLPEVTVRF